jgi:hypothetical protein
LFLSYRLIASLPSGRSLHLRGVNDHPHSVWPGFYGQRKMTGARSAPVVAGETGCEASGLENPITGPKGGSCHLKPFADSKVSSMCPTRQRASGASIPAKTAILASYAAMIAAGSAVTAQTSACAKNWIITNSGGPRNRSYFRSVAAMKV